MDEARDIPVDDLLEPWILQRRVDTSSVEYMTLRDSIANFGLIQSLLVRPAKMPGKFEVVTGNRRRAVCKELRLSPVPCRIRNVTDDEMQVLQIQENSQRQEPTVLEYCRQLKKIMKPGMTQRELSLKVHRDSKWVRNVLQMENLTKEAMQSVERGEISLNVGYNLAKLPISQQPKFLTLAFTITETAFITAVKSHRKKLREAAWEGRFKKYHDAKFMPVPYMRCLKILTTELTDRKIGSIRAINCTPQEAWYDAIKWVLHLDETSVNEQEERHTERMKTKVLEDEACE